MKVKATRSFSSVVGHIEANQVFILPDSFVSDYTIQGLVVVYVEPEAVPDKGTFKTMKKK